MKHSGSVWSARSSICLGLDDSEKAAQLKTDLKKNQSRQSKQSKHRLQKETFKEMSEVLEVEMFMIFQDQRCFLISSCQDPCLFCCTYFYLFSWSLCISLTKMTCAGNTCVYVIMRFEYAYTSESIERNTWTFTFGVCAVMLYEGLYSCQVELKCLNWQI